MDGLDSLVSARGVAAVESASEDEEVRAAIYARTSSTSQKFGYSIDEQVRQCWERCQNLNWTVTRVFRDEAKSGEDTDRPMFQEMLSKAERGQFDVLVFWKLDRFSRSIMHVVTLEREFREYGIALHSVTEQIDTTSAAGRFNFRNIANAAEFERDMIKQRTQMGLQALALDHRWPNDTPPLGYEKVDDGTLAIDEEEAELVTWIFSTYVQERSMPEVAQKLNQRGVETRANEEWTARAVGDVLRNELYAGHYSVADVEETVDEYRIVEQDLFDRVTEIRHRFRSGGDSKREPMPKSRKEAAVDEVTETYEEYLDYAGEDE